MGVQFNRLSQVLPRGDDRSASEAEDPVSSGALDRRRSGGGGGGGGDDNLLKTMPSMRLWSAPADGERNLLLVLPPEAATLGSSYSNSEQVKESSSPPSSLEDEDEDVEWSPPSPRGCALIGVTL